MIEQKLLGRYRLDEKIGEGGMATVFRGLDTTLRRRVAIKIMRPQYAADADFVARFYDEAQQAAKLSHPNIVGIYDVGHEADAYFIVMELVEGTTLDALIRKEGRLPEGVAIDFATQICSGLAYAHRAGLIHRDIKPANVLVTDDDVVKISDFGIARAIAEATVGLTQPGNVLGSVAYISPEQAQALPLAPTSDLYSLGIVLYQMLTGTVPFTGTSAVSVALKHVNETAPDLADADPTISPALAAIVRRLLAKDAGDRFASASDVAAALREARERPAVAARRRPDVAQPPPRRAAERHADDAVAVHEGRRPVVLFLALAVALVASIVLSIILTPRLGTLVSRPRPIENLVGLSLADAQTQLANEGYTVALTRRTSTVSRDRILAQDPAAGAVVAPHATIALVASDGPPQLTLLDLRAYSLADAQRYLTGAGLASTVQRKFDAAPKDTVIGQRPTAGSTIAEHARVVLLVSDGPAPVTVPSLVSMPLPAARDAAARANLAVVVGDRQQTSAIAPDTVVSQEPRPGARIAAGSPITIVVSSAPASVAVPALAGQPLSSARAGLDAAGIAYRIVFVVQSGTAPGTVIDQQPPSGAALDGGRSVVLTVAVPGLVPSVAGQTIDGARRALEASGYHLGAVIGSPRTVVRTNPAAGSRLDPGSNVDVYTAAAAEPNPQPGAPNVTPTGSGP